MDYQTMLQIIRNINAADLVKLNEMVTILTDLSHPDAALLATTLGEFEKIVNHVGTLSKVPVNSKSISIHERFINRLERLSICENVIVLPKVPTDPPPLLPPIEPYFSRRDFAWFEFGGVGSEIDKLHLGMVWEDNADNDEITVIPTTSTFDKEYEDKINLGVISGLPKGDTILLVNKMMRVSRKRASLYKNKYVQGTLLGQLEYRVRWSIALTFLQEKSLHYFILHSCGDELPADFTTSYQDIRFMPVRDVSYDPTAHVLHYRVWDKKDMTFIQLKPVHGLPRNFTSKQKEKFKLDLLDRYYSKDPTRKTKAISFYVAHY
jgi:hypothetical protein